MKNKRSGDRVKCLAEAAQPRCHFVMIRTWPVAFSKASGHRLPTTQQQFSLEALISYDNPMSRWDFIVPSVHNNSNDVFVLFSYASES